jgi:hypothetical protein
VRRSRVSGRIEVVQHGSIQADARGLAKLGGAVGFEVWSGGREDCCGDGTAGTLSPGGEFTDAARS